MLHGYHSKTVALCNLAFESIFFNVILRKFVWQIFPDTVSNAEKKPQVFFSNPSNEKKGIEKTSKNFPLSLFRAMDRIHRTPLPSEF